MKKLLLTLFLFSQSLYSYCQENFGTLEYVFKQDFEKLKNSIDTIKSEDVKNIVQSIYEQSSKSKLAKFSLKYNQDSAFFFLENKAMIDDNNDLNIYRVEAFSYGNFYNNLKTDEIINQKKHKEKDYLILIKGNSDYELIFTDEKKIIGKYECKKALLKKAPFLNNALNNENIEIWYDPEIKVPVGPFGITQIPGLIVEIKLSKMSSLHLTQSNFDAFVNNIERPKVGEIIRLEDFHRFSKKKK